MCQIFPSDEVAQMAGSLHDDGNVLDAKGAQSTAIPIDPWRL